MRPKSAGWYEILAGARRLCPGGIRPFSAEDLAREAGIRDAGVAKAAQIASSWLAKFVRWKYAERAAENRQGPTGRPRTLYTLTEKGMTCVEKEGRVTLLTRLVSAAREYLRWQGTKGERQARAALEKTCDDVEAVLREGEGR